MRGWSSDAAVRGILDSLSRLHGARLLAHETLPARGAAMSEVVVGGAGVGWVAMDWEGPPPAALSGGGAESLVAQAAQAVATHVSLLADLQSLSAEVAETYEELNLFYSLGESLGTLHDERGVCTVVMDLAQRVIGGERGSIYLTGAEHEPLRLMVQRNMPEGAGLSPVSATEGIIGWVLAAGRALIADDLSRLPQEIARDDDGQPADHELLQPPLLCAPLRSRGRSIGVINLSNKAFGRPFTAQDLKLAQAVASTAAVFIEIMRFIEQVRDGERLRSELEIARTIQQGLLPRRDPVIPGIDVAGLCRPASDVGGDYYGFVEEAVPGMTGMTIMDVSGHSVGAAVCMASTRSILRCEAWSRRSTREVVERVNDLVCEDLEEGGMYATFFYGLYDHNAGELRYTNAGHPAPLLLKAGEQRCRRLTMGGMGVGICPRQPYREETVRMTAGDVLLMYTDGLTEARNPAQEMFGEARLGEAVGRYRQATAWEIVSAILGEVSAFVGAAPQGDDIAIVVMKAVSTSRKPTGGT